MSVLWLKSRNTVKHSLSPWEFPRAPPSGFPSCTGYISPYIPPLVIIQIQYWRDINVQCTTWNRGYTKFGIKNSVFIAEFVPNGYRVRDFYFLFIIITRVLSTTPLILVMIWWRMRKNGGKIKMYFFKTNPYAQLYLIKRFTIISFTKLSNWLIWNL